MTEKTKETLRGWGIGIAIVAVSVFSVYNMEIPPPKVYKNGYEVVKIGNCEYLKDYGMFHETLVHDGECKNHTK